jgi:hypothetical protein
VFSNQVDRSMELPSRALLVIVGACVSPVEHPVNGDELQPRLTEKAIIAECRGGSGNEVRLAGEVDPDAPILVLEEIHLHGEQPPQPTIAIWSDGRVLFNHLRSADADHRSFELLQGSIAKSTVQTLVRDVTAELVTVPRYADAEHVYFIDGGQLTTITVHNGDRWISATVYGAYEEEFLAAAAGAHLEKKVEPPTPVPSEDEIDTSRYLPAFEPPSPSPPFSRAYKRLLETRPDRGAPFAAYDFDVAFMFPDPYYVRMGQTEMAWPRDLPAPPSATDIEASDPEFGVVSPYMLDAKYRDAALRLRDTLRASKVPPYFLVDGKRFMVRVDGFYRGERSIEAMFVCSEHLAKEHER